LYQTVLFEQGEGGFLKWLSGSTVLGGLYMASATNTITAYTGNFTTPVGVASSDLPLNQWAVLQVWVKIADGEDGFIRVKINDDEVINFYGDTKPSSETGITSFILGQPKSLASMFYLDDLIVHDTSGSYNTSWPNGAPVYRLAVTGKTGGAPEEWTRSAGAANWECLDEVPPSLTDNLKPTAAGQVDRYTLADLPGGVNAVGTVILEHWGQTVGNPAVNAIQGHLYHDSVAYYAAAQALSPSFGPVQTIYERAPDDTVWDVSKVNALEVGQKSASV
jgi:hypothetical protein